MSTKQQNSSDTVHHSGDNDDDDSVVTQDRPTTDIVLGEDTVVTERDFEIVKRQLKKKKIARPARVLRRCVWGYPQITFAFSSAGGTPRQQDTEGAEHADAQTAMGQASAEVKFEDQHVPGTLIWLTCPRVREMVSKFESRGGITQLREQFGLPTGRSDTQRQRKRLRAIVAENADEKSSAEVVAAAAAATVAGSTDSKAQDKDGSAPQIPEITRLLLQSHENHKAWLRDSGLLSRSEYNKWRTGNASADDDAPDRRFGNAAVNVAASIKCAHAHMATFMIPGVEDYVGRATFEHLKKDILPDPEYQEGGGPPVDDMEDLHVLDCTACKVQCRKFDPAHTDEKK